MFCNSFLELEIGVILSDVLNSLWTSVYILCICTQSRWIAEIEKKYCFHCSIILHSIVPRASFFSYRKWQKFFNALIFTNISLELKCWLLFIFRNTNFFSLIYYTFQYSFNTFCLFYLSFCSTVCFNLM